jgi:hypothetical protein
MYFFATGHVTHPEQLAPLMADEKRVLAELRELGVVREAFTPAGGHGVLSFLEGPGLGEVRAQMGRLPFVANRLLTFDYTEVSEL